MNTMQRIVLWIGSILIILSALFPPWTAGFAQWEGKEEHLVTHMTVYAPFSEAPQPRVDTSIWRDPMPEPVAYLEGAFRLDVPRLLMQELTILIATAMVYKALSPKTRT